MISRLIENYWIWNKNEISVFGLYEVDDKDLSILYLRVIIYTWENYYKWNILGTRAYDPSKKHEVISP